MYAFKPSLSFMSDLLMVVLKITRAYQETIRQGLVYCLPLTCEHFREAGYLEEGSILKSVITCCWMYCCGGTTVLFVSLAKGFQAAWGRCFCYLIRQNCLLWILMQRWIGWAICQRLQSKKNFTRLINTIQSWDKHHINLQHLLPSKKLNNIHSKSVSM